MGESKEIGEVRTTEPGNQVTQAIVRVGSKIGS